MSISPDPGVADTVAASEPLAATAATPAPWKPAPRSLLRRILVRPELTAVLGTIVVVAPLALVSVLVYAVMALVGIVWLRLTKGE